MTIAALLSHDGLKKTDLYCHNCNKNFIAELDYSIDGQHTIECPWCGHGHCRVIKSGKVTEDRWSSTEGDGIKARRVWKHHSLQITTSTAAAFIRDRWLDKD